MTWSEDHEFEEMLRGVLRDTANPEVREGLAGRIKAAFRREAANTASQGFWMQGRAVQGNAMAETGVLAGGGVREVGVFRSIRDAVREIAFRRRAAPLVPVSRPVASADRMLERREFAPFAWAMSAHALAILLIGLTMATRPNVLRRARPLVVSIVEAPPPIKMLAQTQTTGGGGGQRGPVPPAQGRLPRSAATQEMPPKAPPTVQPKIALEPTVAMQRDLKMADNALPNLGLPNSTILEAGALGTGSGTGIGAGQGGGVGTGMGGNTGGGPMRIGGGVSAPVPLSMPDPEFSEEARKAKLSGNVLVYLWVDPQGRPTHVRVIRGIGMGLDEKAAAAVRQYRFQPALRNGKPVTVEMNVEVNFQIF